MLLGWALPFPRTGGAPSASDHGSNARGHARRGAPAEVRVFWLITGAESEDNLRLYRKAGYEVVADTVDSAGVELVVLEKPVR